MRVIISNFKAFCLESAMTFSCINEELKSYSSMTAGNVAATQWVRPLLNSNVDNMIRLFGYELSIYYLEVPDWNTNPGFYENRFYLRKGCCMYHCALVIM